MGGKKELPASRRIPKKNGKRTLQESTRTGRQGGNMSETLTCTVDRITYNNAENGYSVTRCTTGSGSRVTVVGIMPRIMAGSVLEVTGEWKTHKKYGTQFQADLAVEKIPATARAIERYLGGGMIKGVGPLNAKRIVSCFGEETLDIIDREPERLLEVKGIGKKIMEKIREGWEAQKEIRSIMLFLHEKEINQSLAMKIFKQYGNESIRTIEENPYRLAEEVWGIGFKTADEIAMKLGFEKTGYMRIRAGISYVLSRATEDGHCFLTMEQLHKKGAKILECDECYIVMTLDDMIRMEMVIREDDAVYLPFLYRVEKSVARKLCRLQDAPGSRCGNREDLAAWLEEETGIPYDEGQVDGIVTAVENPVSILTGGPGTGKTTTTLGIIKVLRQMGKDILLAAPTGRAAKRLSESTGMEAMTIHRLLGAHPPQGFEHDEDNPLEGDVLIVDEASMIDILLLNSLLKAVPDHMSLLLIGDVDQLPSVGPGNVLRDLIGSGAFPCTSLTHIFRQAAESRIITTAHQINRGQMPDLANHREQDLFFVPCRDNEEAADKIVRFASENLVGFRGLAKEDIQVLSPMKKSSTGTLSLNERLQQALNPGSGGIHCEGAAFRKGDKVLQTKNDYEKNVFNGDVGFITSIEFDPDDPGNAEVAVDFEGRRVTYDMASLPQLMHAYAMTIHKSQGSEYPAVIIPVTSSHWVMLQRNLLYTGITRAKNLLVLVGEKRAIEQCVRNQEVRKRNTRLKERIQEEISGEA